VRAALGDSERRFGLAVIGGHGDRYAGVKLADGLWQGDGADLHHVGLLVLCACAVGRLQQIGDRDVEGLYTKLVVHKGRSVVAARWPIADTEAATFVAELAHQYMLAVDGERGRERFARSRALNEARKYLLDHSDPRYRVSWHLAAAFELYGLG
jgi:CHAT domain-containing protein